MRSSCASDSVSPALARARTQLKERLDAIQLRLDALQPLARSHDSIQWLDAMGDALEECLLSIDRAVMTSAERTGKSPSRDASDNP